MPASGPESVIDEVERRAPHGFTRLTDVIDPAELQNRVDAYAHAHASGADRETDRSPVRKKRIAHYHTCATTRPAGRSIPSRSRERLAVSSPRQLGQRTALPGQAPTSPRVVNAATPNPRCTSRTVTSQDRDEIGAVVRSYRMTTALDQSSGTSCPRTLARSGPDWDQRGDA
jgi:hypothetical protein